MEDNQLHERVEAYLAALEAPLAELPAARREEFVDETRAHLGAMVEAKRADGLGEEAAWNAAMEEFGEPTEVGRALWKQWATSGQLESEGELIPTRELAKKFNLAFGFWVHRLRLDDDCVFALIRGGERHFSFYSAFSVLSLEITARTAWGCGGRLSAS